MNIILLVLLSAFSNVLSFNYLTYDISQNIQELINFPEVDLEGRYSNDIKLMAEADSEEKIATCMLLIRNNLFVVNEDIQTILKETKFNKNEVFDRALIDMYNNCIDKISPSIINDIYNTEKAQEIHNPNRGIDFKLDTEKLIKTKPLFSSIDKEILKILYDEKDISNTTESVSMENVENNVIVEFFNELTFNKIKFMFMGFVAGVILFLLLNFSYKIISKTKKAVVTQNHTPNTGKKIKTK